MIEGAVSVAGADDLDFLREMLREAAYPPEERGQPIGRALAPPQIRRYLDGWGRSGDLAVVARDPRTGGYLGAAWYRLFAENEPGFGFVDEETPELTVAVVEERRGCGVGTALLAALIAEARAAGHAALSLSVSPRNPVAIRLYERAGFRRVRSRDEHLVMRLALS